MQLYITSNCPVQSAVSLDDQSLTESIKDTNILLSNACWEIGSIGPLLPINKETDLTKWVYNTSSNFLWTLWHFEALLSEYHKRFNWQLKKFESYVNYYYNKVPQMQEGDLTPFVNQAKDEGLLLDFTDIQSVTEAYNKLLNEKYKLNKPKWSNH